MDQDYLGIYYTVLYTYLKKKNMKSADINSKNLIRVRMFFKGGIHIQKYKRQKLLKWMNYHMEYNLIGQHTNELVVGTVYLRNVNRLNEKSTRFLKRHSYNVKPTYSFLHSFIRSFLHSFFRSYLHSFFRLFLHGIHSFVLSCIH